MSIKSFIPMHPDQRPQQRIAPVVTLPPKPEGLDVKLDWVEGMPDDRPEGSPRKVEFLCSVEWAWSPMHGRIDNYYLHRRGKRWLLWVHWLDEDEVPWKWRWVLFAYADFVKGDMEQIAVHMLIGAWKETVKYEEIERYHWINATGLLSVETIQAAAREVWE